MEVNSVVEARLRQVNKVGGCARHAVQENPELNMRGHVHPISTYHLHIFSWSASQLSFFRKKRAFLEGSVNGFCSLLGFCLQDTLPQSPPLRSPSPLQDFPSPFLGCNVWASLNARFLGRNTLCRCRDKDGLSTIQPFHQHIRWWCKRPWSSMINHRSPIKIQQSSISHQIIKNLQFSIKKH